MTAVETESASAIIVRACKYDGTVHRSWRARVLQQDAELLVLDGKFEAEVRHALLGTIVRGTMSIEYYWLDRWYNVFRFLEPDGSLRNYYCNINIPPVFDGRALSFIDLDIDVMVAPDLSYQIIDEDEFKENALRYAYPEDVQAGAHKALDELVHLIESRQFPFNDNH